MAAIARGGCAGDGGEAALAVVGRLRPLVRHLPDARGYALKHRVDDFVDLHAPAVACDHASAMTCQHASAGRAASASAGNVQRAHLLPPVS